MKHLLGLVVGICVMAVLISCASGNEAAGDKAYELSKKATGDARRTQLKTAYVYYRKAVMDSPDKVSSKLRNRFLEMCLVRASMVLDEGGAHMDAIIILMDDIEGQLKDDVQSDIRQQYAAFLTKLGDSSAIRDKHIDALKYYDRAIEKAADAALFREKRQGVIQKVAQKNYETGLDEFESGVKSKDVTSLIRSEYFAKVALHFDSTHEKAQKLLSDAYKENLSTYAAFLSVVDDYTDTLLFKQINKYDILLAIPATKGNTYIINMHSYTYNPLRMRSEHFALVDVNGKKYPAASGQKMPVDILDQEREAQYTLNFPAVSAQIKKMVYENGPHYTEKNFF